MTFIPGFYLAAVLFFISFEIAESATGDTINIFTHYKTKVITDPSKRSNAYYTKLQFYGHS